MSRNVQLRRGADRKRPFGDHLADLMDRRDMTAAELARRTALVPKHVSELLSGKAPLTPETAVKLSPALGASASFLLAIEHAHRAAQIQLEADGALEGLTDWAKEFPIQELTRRRRLGRGLAGVPLVRELLTFFGAADRAALESVWEQRQLAFRRTGLGDGSAKAVQTWLRLGEIDAQRIHTSSFDRERLTAWVRAEARRLTRLPLSGAWHMAVEQLAEVGVALVLVPEIKPLTKVNGACNWVLPDKVIIQVSGRNNRSDILWFNVLHELGHALNDAKRTIYVASDDDDYRSPQKEEDAADRFAARALGTQSAVARLSGEKTTKRQLQQVARYEQVGDHILAGALLREDPGLYRRRRWLPGMLEWFDIIEGPTGEMSPVARDSAGA